MTTRKEKRTVRFASDIENSTSNIVDEIEAKINNIQCQKRVVPSFDINDIKKAIDKGKSVPKYFDTTRDMISAAKSPNHRYTPYQSISRFTTPIKFSELVQFNKNAKVNVADTITLKPISSDMTVAPEITAIEGSPATTTKKKENVDLKAEIPYLVRVLKEGQSKEREEALDKLMVLAVIAEHRSRLYKYGIVAPLLDIMTKGSATAYPNAARALMNISAVVENKIAMFADPSVIPAILNLLKSCNDDAMKSGLGILYNLAMPIENKTLMFHHKDFMVRMTSLMQQQDAVIQERVCAVLRQLAVVDELAIPMFKYKGVFACIRNVLLGNCGTSSTLAGKENASGILYHLTHCVALRVPVLKTGIVSGVIHLLTSKGSWELRKNIIGMFFHLCIPIVNKMPMFNEGVVTVVGAVLSNIHCDLETKRRGVGVLLQLSFAPDTRMFLVNDSKHRVVHVLVGMLQLQPDAEECIGWAAGCLLNMTEPAEGRGTVYLAGAVPPLLKLLEHVGVEGGETSIAVRENAAGAIANLSIAVENKIPMFEIGVVQSILKFLQDRTLNDYNQMASTPIAQEKAIWAISNLVRCNAIRQKMLELDILPALVDAMDRGTLLCKQYATVAVMRLSDEDGNEARLLQAGVIRPLVTLVNSESEAIAQDAVEALFNLCIDDGCRCEAKKHGLTREQIGWQDLF